MSSSYKQRKRYKCQIEHRLQRVVCLTLCRSVPDVISRDLITNIEKAEFNEHNYRLAKREMAWHFPPQALEALLCHHEFNDFLVDELIDYVTDIPTASLYRAAIYMSHGEDVSRWQAYRLGHRIGRAVSEFYRNI